MEATLAVLPIAIGIFISAIWPSINWRLCGIWAAVLAIVALVLAGWVMLFSALLDGGTAGLGVGMAVIIFLLLMRK